jgi:hypothetical protein
MYIELGRIKGSSHRFPSRTSRWGGARATSEYAAVYVGGDGRWRDAVGRIISD